jgi:hypothetical protein
MMAVGQLGRYSESFERVVAAAATFGAISEVCRLNSTTTTFPPLRHMELKEGTVPTYLYNT